MPSSCCRFDLHLLLRINVHVTRTSDFYFFASLLLRDLQDSTSVQPTPKPAIAADLASAAFAVATDSTVSFDPATLHRPEPPPSRALPLACPVLARVAVAIGIPPPGISFPTLVWQRLRCHRIAVASLRRSRVLHSRRSRYPPSPLDSAAVTDTATGLSGLCLRHRRYPASTASGQILPHPCNPQRSPLPPLVPHATTAASAVVAAPRGYYACNNVPLSPPPSLPLLPPYGLLRVQQRARTPPPFRYGHHTPVDSRSRNILPPHNTPAPRKSYSLLSGIPHSA